MSDFDDFDDGEVDLPTETVEEPVVIQLPAPSPDLTTDNEDLQQLRELVYGAHINMPFPQRVLVCLANIHCRPHLARSIGLIELSHDRIAVCTKLASDFLGIKINSLNTDFRQHAFRCLGQLKMEDDLPGVLRGSDHRRWSVWENTVVRFSRSTPAHEIAHLVECARCWRSQLPFPELNPPGPYENMWVKQTTNS
jgi:hypothetical protein